jgi:hypothetical protein
MLRVRTVFTGPAGTPWLSTMYFSSGGLQSDADAAVVSVGAFWNAVDAGMSSTVSWSTEPDVADIDLATGELETSWSTTPQTGSGASAGDMLPTLAQALVRWRTPGVVNGRRVRGRTFVPGVTEAFAAAGRPIAAYLTTLNTAAAALIADANSQFVIWSRPFESDPDDPDDPPTRAGTQHVVSSGTAWSEFASMRSRRD